MKNGFTLIELLGVIVILSLLMLLVIPKITNSIRNSSNNTDDLTKQMIYDAAKLHMTDNQDFYKKTNGNVYCIPLYLLVDDGSLKSPIKLSDSKEDISEKQGVKITYNNGFKYSLIDKNECNNYVNTVEILNKNGYQQVQWIESTGESFDDKPDRYIDLPYNFNPETDEIELRFKLINISNWDYYLLAANVWDTSRRFAMGGSCVGYFSVGYGTDSTDKTIYPSKVVPDTNSFHVEKYANKTFTLDEKYVFNVSSISFAGETKNLRLFFGYNHNSPGYISYYEQKRNGHLILKMVPCYRKSDNKIGMYDIVSDKFYTNQGTGDFIKGENVYN